jgi:hypothetical protein
VIFDECRDPLSGIRDPGRLTRQIVRCVRWRGTPVKNRCSVCLLFFLFSAICFPSRSATQGSTPGEEFAGVWSGSWAGAGGSGGFELTLEKGKDGVTGRVSVTGEPTYRASFKALSFDGKKMNAKYDFPPNEASAEVWLTATFEDAKAAGTWSLRVKQDGSEVAAGTWSVTKK